jgi:hypothetical protein
LDTALEWLHGLPISGVARYDHLADVPLDGTDVLWVRGLARPDHRLPDWLRTGGRLLATGDGALLPSALGLERGPPGPLELQPPGPGYGLAGFGAHPLFTGLRGGAMLAPASSGAPVLLTCYDGDRPARAGVVAVERRGLELRAERTLAWEYALGAGGVLCLAFHPSLPATDSAELPPDAEVVLANALVGEAVPHRDRAAVVLWPAPGRAARAVPVGPSLPEAPSDRWPPSSLPALDLNPAATWTLAGRRVLITARPAAGTREVWAPPLRVMRAATVRDSIPGAPERIAAEGVAGGLALGDHRLLERWMAAPDVAVAVWEIGGPEGVPVVAEWEVDLRRAWPYPAGSYGDLDYGVADEGASLRVQATGGPRAVFAVAGGVLSARASAGQAPAVEVRCAGATPLRIVAAAGVDQSELERSLRVLARDGVAGLAAARGRKAAQLDRHGTAFEAPDEQLGRGFAWARQRGDEALIGAPGIGRSLLTACPRSAGQDAWCFGPRACAAAAAQLVAGNRDPARELLKYLAQAQRPGGGIPSSDPIGGLSSAIDATGTVAFLALVERFLAWTADMEAVRRLREPCLRALTYLAAGREQDPAPSARVLDALEEFLGGADGAAAVAALRVRAGEVSDPVAGEAYAVVEAAAAALRRDPGALPDTGAATALLEAVTALWGLEPDAPNAALAIAPLAPPGWSGLALRRLQVGRTLLDLELRRRAGALVLRTAHRFGSRLVLSAGVRGVEVEATEVDDVPLAGARARFETHDRHEVRFLLRG